MLLWLFKNDDSHNNPCIGSRDGWEQTAWAVQICVVPDLQYIPLVFYGKSFSGVFQKTVLSLKCFTWSFSYLKGWGGRECLLFYLWWPSRKLYLDSWQLSPVAVLSPILDTTYFTGLPWDWDQKGFHLFLHTSNTLSIFSMLLLHSEVPAFAEISNVFKILSLLCTKPNPTLSPVKFHGN